MGRLPGIPAWQRKRLIQDTPTETVRSTAVGRTELTGTAEPTDGVGAIEQPFTDGECLVATYEAEEWRDDADGGNWATVDSGTLVVPFELDDGTGRIRVEPDADATYEFSEDNRTRFRVGPGQTPPAEVVAFFERRDGTDDDAGPIERVLASGPDAHSGARRRYTQEVLPPGEDAYLLGGAHPTGEAAGSNPDRLVVRRDRASDEFVISDKAETELVSGYRWTGPVMILGGIAISAVMLYLILL